MIRKTLQLNNKAGLRGAPALKIVETVNKFDAHVEFERQDGLRINGRSIGMIQMLRLEQGDEVDVTADGFDEKMVIDALTKLFENNFYES